MLKTLHSNKKNKLPIQLFEVSDVVLLDDSEDNEVGAKNQRKVAALYTDTKHSCLDVSLFDPKNIVGTWNFGFLNAKAKNSI